MINQVTNTNLVVLDTMNLWIDISLESLKNVISKTNMYLLNDEEAILLTNKNTIEDAAELLMKMGPEIVIIKKGSQGSYL